MLNAVHRILIADDEPAILDGYRMVFASRQSNDDKASLEAEIFGGTQETASRPVFDLVFCRQGEEAVAAAQQACREGRPFAVAFLDVRMPPGLTGVQAAQRIRAIDQHVNIVFVTGYADLTPETIAQVVPPVERLFYMAKPFQPMEVQQLASALSNKWQLEQDLGKQHEALKQRERELWMRNLQFDAALNNMVQGLCMFDAGQRLVVSNRRFGEIYGLAPDALRPGAHVPEIMSGPPSGLVADGDGVHHRHLDDGRIIAVVRQPMAEGGWLETHEDVTERKRAETRIQYMANHDALTDLPNRTLFRDRMEQALARVRRQREMLSVLCLDLDHFKSVNDTLGHPLGDALLKQVASRLQAIIRETDTIARLGGDEFAIIQVGIEQPEDAAALAERVIETLSQPYDLSGQQVVIGTSVGIALSSSDGDAADQLLKAADMALYRAKSDGRGTFRYFEPEMDVRAQARRALEVDLRQALVKQEFELYYQPIVSLADEGITGFEALIRWRHPVRGTVSPAEFIPLAEETGFIIPLGEWILRRACADAIRWPAHLKVAVNLSPVQFKHRGLGQVVMAALAETGLAASRLELEITESVLLYDGECTMATLQGLKELGVRISMDDFGTGYSSLSYLRSFPFDKIKIDRSFVKDLEANTDAAAIVRAVIGLGNSLGMATTAEGVETQEQVEYLRQQGCPEVQGYYFGRPRPAGDVPAVLASDQAKAAIVNRTAQEPCLVAL